jgi:ribosomal protein L29
MNKKKIRELTHIVLERKKVYLKLRFKKKLGQIKNTNNIVNLKRKIAKIMTKINNKILL